VMAQVCQCPGVAGPLFIFVYLVVIGSECGSFVLDSVSLRYIHRSVIRIDVLDGGYLADADRSNLRFRHVID
jgi:hypothetical protein